MDTWYPKPIWKRAREMQENIFHILLCIGPINNEFQKFQLLFKNLIFKVKYILDVKQIFLFVCFILEFLPCEIWKRIYSLCIPSKYRLQNFTRSESPSSGFETCLDHLMLLFNPQATGFLFVEGGALERNTAWVSPCWAAWGCTYNAHLEIMSSTPVMTAVYYHTNLREFKSEWTKAALHRTYPKFLKDAFK